MTAIANLRQELIRQWQEDGYVLIERFFDLEQIDRLSELVDAYIEQSRCVTASDSVFDLDPRHSVERPLIRRIKNPDSQHETFREFARDAGIVDVLQELLDNGVRLEVGKINLKLPGARDGIAWHQDYAFSPLTNDDSAAVGIFIDDVTEANGPLLVVPGSHRWLLVSHHHDGRFGGYIRSADAGFDSADVTKITGPRGSISIHHCRTLHASAPNLSTSPRRIYFNQYHAADAWPYLGVSDLAWWRDRLLAGVESFSPRVTMTDFRLPLPADQYGSIFEVQRAAEEGAHPDDEGSRL